MITLTGLSPRQRQMADILWLTHDVREVERLCRLDTDACIVRDLMIAAELDQVVTNSSLEQAQSVLSQFTL
jgi:ABC-type Mn2+/Zn2+ transport system ATPase subunit